MSRHRRIAAAVLVLLLKRKYQKKNKSNKPRRTWVRNWIARRPMLGAYSQLLSELRSEDPKQFKNFLRMSEKDFNFLLNLVHHKIEKLDTNMRESIKPSERLAITLRFLATG